MSGTIEFDGGLTAALKVSDLGASIAWYGEMLGFQLLYRVDEIGWCELASPVERVNVGLSQVEQMEASGDGATLTFGVRDLAAARAFLEARDVRFDGPTQTIPGLTKLATFFDPDGNALMLYEDLAKAHGGPGG